MFALLQPRQLFRVCVRCEKQLLRQRSLPIPNSEYSSLCHLILNGSLPKSVHRQNSSHSSVNNDANKEASVGNSDSSVNNYANEGASKGNESSVQYVVSHEDFKWVRRLLPPSVIPEPPKHSTYPTPSGWSPPSETVPDLPYYVPRNRYHDIPVYLSIKHTNQYLTSVRYVEGDIWALEKDLTELVRPNLPFDPATRVHEVTRTVYVKGNFVELVKGFLLEKGF